MTDDLRKKILSSLINGVKVKELVTNYHNKGLGSKRQITKIAREIRKTQSFKDAFQAKKYEGIDDFVKQFLEGGLSKSDILKSMRLIGRGIGKDTLNQSIKRIGAIRVDDYYSRFPVGDKLQLPINNNGLKGKEKGYWYHISFVFIIEHGDKYRADVYQRKVWKKSSKPLSRADLIRYLKEDFPFQSQYSNWKLHSIAILEDSYYYG